MIFHVGGELVEPDLESVIERRVYDFINYCQGIMHLNQRYDVWMRISKDTAAKMDYSSLRKGCYDAFQDRTAFHREDGNLLY